MKKMITNIAIPLVLIFVTGCGNKTVGRITLDEIEARDRATNPVDALRTRANPENENYRLSCRSGAQCPQATGLLLSWKYNETEQQYDTFRCTANLIAPDKILTNYHCARLEGASSFFMLTDGTRRRVNSQHLQRSAPEIYTDEGGRETVSGYAPDYVVLQLEQPITNVQPYVIQTEFREEPTTARAVVVNSSRMDSATSLVIDVLDCRVKTDFWWFPFKLSERNQASPTFPVFGCPLSLGNSGGAVIDSDNKLIAIIHATRTEVDSVPSQQVVSDSAGRPLTARQQREAVNRRLLSRHLDRLASFRQDPAGALQRLNEPREEVGSDLQIGFVTNLSCFDIAAGSSENRCLSLSYEQIIDRVNQRLDEEMRARSVEITRAWFTNRTAAIEQENFHMTIAPPATIEAEVGDAILRTRATVLVEPVPHCVMADSVSRLARRETVVLRVPALILRQRHGSLLDVDFIQRTVDMRVTMSQLSANENSLVVGHVAYEGDAASAELISLLPAQMTIPPCQ